MDMWHRGMHYQLGFLTKEGSGAETRWKDSTLHSIDDATNAGLGSFMAAMGYDLDRLNASPPGGVDVKKGQFVQTLLTKEKEGVPWKEFQGGANHSSVAEYYSSIYGAAQSAGKGSTEDICTKYPLLVLHILASGYFRAGSAGAKGIIPAPKAPSSDPRKPRTIREILYWLSALPYSQGYKALVERMKGKYPPKDGVPNETVDKIEIHGQGNGDKTDLKKDCITHYLLAACGYCPLVLIGIQGTIATSGNGTDSAPATGSAPAAAGADQNKCPKHKDNRNKRCDPKDIGKQQATGGSANGQELQAGQVCYGGYHLEVSKFGPLHGMYANGLYGFDMDLSAAQCLDQLRVYVYHCFYQLYFLRKQCGTGAIAAGGAGGAGSGVVLGWKSCRYGNGVSTTSANKWICQGTGSNGNEHSKNCGLQNAAGSGTGSGSPLMAFLCDTVTGLHCGKTVGVDLGSGKQGYPEIDEHMNCPAGTLGHFGGPPNHCPVPMGWSKDITGSGANRANHFKDLTKTHKTAELEPKGQQNNTYPAHCTGKTLAHLLEYYCDPEKCHGTLVVLLRLLACITPTVPRTLGDLFGFYYYVVYIGGESASGGGQQESEVRKKLKDIEKAVSLNMGRVNYTDGVLQAVNKWSVGDCSQPSSHSTAEASLKTLFGCAKGTDKCCPYLSPLSGQQYGQLSPLMAGTYLSWLVYLIGEFKDGLGELEKAFKGIECKNSDCKGQGAVGCGGSGQCRAGTHGDTCPAAGGSGSAGSAVAGKGGSGVANQGVCGCDSVVSCTGVLPVLYKYGFGYGNVAELHKECIAWIFVAMLVRYP
ncbi:variant erythrocyte surface antigen-1 beta subunit [Babesia bovis T2Bo]|uniref:variant erythrocyte surface antigen-1 beta subunit n=1 Tax=Babesia bovis T2Bo TaxID=484906 RepID=UPI001C3574AE|nr:variant erythrocyte surface antigen-1 beta subunit [Babesia bovis T2Bo]EDO07682.2 variant erythrocyte surface antigen-1 beta subunit [Babesia bovis T2Bo]